MVITQQKNSRSILFILLIVLITTLVYVSSLSNGFIGDDYVNIVENHFIRSWDNFPLLFSKTYLPSQAIINSGEITSGFNSTELSYRPLVTLSYFLDFSLWGLKPFGYHLTNLILHILNAILLFLIIRLVAKNEQVALFASLLFALHPVNSEAVISPAFREDLLAFFFYICSFICYLKAFNQDNLRKWRVYFCSLFSFMLALFSKEMAITLPLMLIFHDYCFVFKGKMRDHLAQFKSRYLGYFLVAIFYLWIWGFVMRNHLFYQRPYELSFLAIFFTISSIIAQYLQWIFIPLGIHSALSSQQFVVKAFTLELGISLLVILLFIFLAIRISKRSKLALFSIGWFFISLLPVTNILLLNRIIALRFLYIPIGGICFLLSIWLMAKSRELKIKTRIVNLKSIIVVILVVYSALTLQRIRVWRDSTIFWSEVASIYPYDIQAYIGMGDGFLEKGELDQAIVCYQKALELDPSSAPTYVSLGNILAFKREHNQAIVYYQRALDIDPTYIFAYYNLSLTYLHMQDFDMAKKTWEAGLKIAPDCYMLLSALNEFSREKY